MTTPETQRLRQMVEATIGCTVSHERAAEARLALDVLLDQANRARIEELDLVKDGVCLVCGSGDDADAAVMVRDFLDCYDEVARGFPFDMSKLVARARAVLKARERST